MTARDWAADRAIQPETPLPYRVVKPGHGRPTSLRCVQLGRDDMYTTLELKPGDAAYLVHAANLLPEALKELERFQKLIDEFAASDSEWVKKAVCGVLRNRRVLARFEKARAALLAAASRSEGRG